MTEAQGQERERLRQLIANYFATYYAEIRRLLPSYPAYTSDPSILPPSLRDHKRIIAIVECADGYIVSHHSDPENRHGTDAHEDFELHTDRQGITVAAASGENFPPYGDFLYGASSWVRNNATGEYSQPDDLRESIDYISNNRAALLTMNTARAEARRDLQEFFSNPDNPFLRNRPQR